MPTRRTSRTPSRVRSPHVVAALVTHGVAPFELAVICEVFGLARPEIVDPWPYEVIIASPDGPRVRTNQCFAIDGARPLSALDRADTIIVPAWSGDATLRPPETMIAALRRAYRRGARLMSVCSGAFALAHAGLLDGRKATTHWRYTDALSASFPEIDVDPDVLYVDAGQILTSAGTAAGIDLCLHVMRMDHGAEIANAVARRMVVPPHRDGGQAQFVEAPMEAEDGADPLAATLDWVLEHLDEPLTVAVMSRRAMMSPRTFARRFRAVTGTTPLQWLLRQRILHAQRLLESTDLPIELIAQRCGFGSASVLRTHFRRVLDTSPLAYRHTFREIAS
jgi:AraC family transcriptional regulator, transcriptional activator FtrA